MNTCSLKDSACSLSSFEWDTNHILDKVINSIHKNICGIIIVVTNHNAVVAVRTFLQIGRETRHGEKIIYVYHIEHLFCLLTVW